MTNFLHATFTFKYICFKPELGIAEKRDQEIVFGKVMELDMCDHFTEDNLLLFPSICNSHLKIDQRNIHLFTSHQQIDKL